MSNQMVLHQALRLGVDYWDTAHSYTGGRSETGIGKFLERYPKERGRIFLVTKAHKRTPEDLESELNQSLERLHTDHRGSVLRARHQRHLRGGSARDQGLGGQDEAGGQDQAVRFSTHRNMEHCLAAAPAWAASTAS